MMRDVHPRLQTGDVVFVRRSRVSCISLREKVEFAQ